MSKLPQETAPIGPVDPFEAVPNQMPTTATVTVIHENGPREVPDYRPIFYMLLILLLIGGISGGAYHYANGT